MNPLWKFGSQVPVIGSERTIRPRCVGIAVQRACHGHRHAGCIFWHGTQRAVWNRRCERIEGGQGSCAHDRSAWIEAEQALWRGTVQASNCRMNSNSLTQQLRPQLFPCVFQLKAANTLALILRALHVGVMGVSSVSLSLCQAAQFGYFFDTRFVPGGASVES